MMTGTTVLTGGPALADVAVPASTTSYLDGWTVALLLTGFLSMGVCAVSGLRGHGPGRVTLALTALLQLMVAVVSTS